MTYDLEKIAEKCIANKWCLVKEYGVYKRIYGLLGLTFHFIEVDDSVCVTVMRDRLEYHSFFDEYSCNTLSEDCIYGLLNEFLEGVE